MADEGASVSEVGSVDPGTPSSQLLSEIARQSIFADNPDESPLSAGVLPWPLPVPTHLQPVAYDLLLLATSLLRSSSEEALRYILGPLRQHFNISAAEHSAHLSALCLTDPSLSEVVSRSVDAEEVLDTVNSTSPAGSQRKTLDRFRRDKRALWSILRFGSALSEEFLDEEEHDSWKSRWGGFVANVVIGIVRSSERSEWNVKDILGRSDDGSGRDPEFSSDGTDDIDSTIDGPDCDHWSKASLIGWLRRQFKTFIVTGNTSDFVSDTIRDIIRLSLTGPKSVTELENGMDFPLPVFPVFTSIYSNLLSPSIRSIFFSQKSPETFLRRVLTYFKSFERGYGITRIHRKIVILKLLFKYYMRIDQAEEEDEVYDDGLDDSDSEDDENRLSPLRHIEATIGMLLSDISEAGESMTPMEKDHLKNVLSIMLSGLGGDLADYVENYGDDYVLLGNRVRVYKMVLQSWVDHVETGHFFEDLYFSNLRRMVLHSTRSHYEALRDEVLAGRLTADGKTRNVEKFELDLGDDNDNEEECDSEEEEESSEYETDSEEEEERRSRAEAKEASLSSEEIAARDERETKAKEAMVAIKRYCTLIDLVKADIMEESNGVRNVFGAGTYAFDLSVVESYLDLLIQDLTKHLDTLEELEDVHIAFFKKLKQFVAFAVKIHMRISPDKSFSTNDLLTPWEPACRRLIDGWFARIQELFNRYTERAVEVEDWKPVSSRSNKLYSSSVLDLFTYLKQSVQFLYNMCVPNLKVYFFGYAQLCAGLVQKYAMTVCEGVPEDAAEALKPIVPPMRDIKMKVRLGIRFRGGQTFEDRLAAYNRKSQYRMDRGKRFGYEELFVRFNDLFYSLLHFIRLINEMCKKFLAINEITHIDSEGAASTKARFAQIKSVTDTFVKQHMTMLSDYIGARNVYVELNSVLFTKLYMREDPTDPYDSTLESLIPEVFDPFTADVADQLMDKRLAQLVLRSTFRHLAAGVSHVIVNGGDERIFNVDDRIVLSRDLRRICSFFEEAGVDRNVIDQAMNKLRTLLTLVMQKPSTELVSGSAENSSYSSLPDECDQQSPWCKGTIYKVLYHRSDDVARRFLGKHTYHYDVLWL